MTTYRLRDRKLHQKLDELSHGAFSEMMKTMGKFMATKSTTHVQLGESRFTVTLHKQDFEISPEYNPNAWNSYPDVTPPEGVWMRTEHRDETDPPGIIRKVGAVFQDGTWRNSTGEAYPSYISIKRFRPWE
jgi:hypothetical protein